MTEDPQTLAEALPREQERCRRLLGLYQSIGPAGAFATAMIRLSLDQAERAAASGDVVAMIRAYKDLSQYKE